MAENVIKNLKNVIRLKLNVDAPIVENETETIVRKESNHSVNEVMPKMY